MKGIPSSAGRGLAGLLFVSMLTIGVVKAQGCQRPVDETPQAEEVTESPTRTNAATDPTPATAAQPAAVAAGSGDAGADAGSDAGEAVEEMRPPMMPATKSGMPFRPQQQNAPKQQKAE